MVLGVTIVLNLDLLLPQPGVRNVHSPWTRCETSGFSFTVGGGGTFSEILAVGGFSHSHTGNGQQGAVPALQPWWGVTKQCQEKAVTMSMATSEHWLLSV